MLQRLASLCLAAAAPARLGGDCLRAAGLAATRLHTSASPAEDSPASASGSSHSSWNSPEASSAMLGKTPLASSAPRHDLAELYFSEAHFNARQAFAAKKARIISEMQAFEHDTGSYPVQIGLISERIAYLTQHCTQHRKDHHSRRGLLVLLSRRRKQLKYLRRQNFSQYVQVINKYGLKDNYYASGWGESYRVGTNLKWTPTESDPDGKMVAEVSLKHEMWRKRAEARKAAKEKQAAEEERRRAVIESRRKNAAAVSARRMQNDAGLLPPEGQAAYGRLLDRLSRSRLAQASAPVGQSPGS